MEYLPVQTPTRAKVAAGQLTKQEASWRFVPEGQFVQVDEVPEHSAHDESHGKHVVFVPSMNVPGGQVSTQLLSTVFSRREFMQVRQFVESEPLQVAHEV